MLQRSRLGSGGAHCDPAHGQGWQVGSSYKTRVEHIKNLVWASRRLRCGRDHFSLSLAQGSQWTYSDSVRPHAIN